MVVDDHPLLLEGIAAALHGETDIKIVGEARNGLEAVIQFRALRPDVTLMDLQMPEKNGLAALRSIRSEFPTAVVVVLTTYGGDVQAVRALRAGASGYLLKSMLRKDLISTIRTVSTGKRVIHPMIAQEIAEHIAEEKLSEREIEVLRHVANGTSNKLIAARLKVTEPTVKDHLKNIMQKLSANDRTHAVTIAMRRGFLDG